MHEKLLRTLDQRIMELRTEYAITEKPEFRYRFLEAQRLREFVLAEQIDHQVTARNGKRRITED